MDVSADIKRQLIEQRLSGYEKRYYDLYLDKIAFEANGDIEAVESTQKRMDSVQKAYEAVESIVIE